MVDDDDEPPIRSGLSPEFFDRVDPEDAPSERQSFWNWSAHVPEPKAGPLDFEAFPFQRELYSENEDARDSVIMKSTQVGISAWGLRWSLYHVDTGRMTALYIFPTQRDVWDFSTARIDPVIEGSAHLRSRQQMVKKSPDNKGMKRIGDGYIYFRGSESKRGLDSVDADIILFDEYDTLVQENIPDAERRVTGPKSVGLIRRVGVPSVPDYGIAALYDKSDQRVWRVKCSACNEWQSVEFENIDLTTAIRVCLKCRKPLDVARGEWVANYPDRDVRGYHVTRLIAPTANMRSIIAASKKRALFEQQVFHNKDLGMPFVTKEGRLSREAIAAAQSIGGEFTTQEGYSGPHLVTMGVDVASVRDLNVRISEHIDDHTKRALWIGTVDSFDELALLMDRYSVNMAAVDHLPDGRLSRAFCERFPGRAYMVSYDSVMNPKDSEVLKVNEEMRHARVRRTEAIDAMAEMIRSQRNHLPMNLPESYVTDLQANVRVQSEDDVGRRTVGYKKMGTSDDFAHAEVYDLVATELWYFRQGVVEAQREVLNPLEEFMEFQRSNLSDYDEEPDYTPGGRGEEWD